MDNGGGGGIVLNMSSVQALQQKSPAVYSATKFAVLQFSNQIAVIIVFCVIYLKHMFSYIYLGHNNFRYILIFSLIKL